jgi:hypothetical protein
MPRLRCARRERGVSWSPAIRLEQLVPLRVARFAGRWSSGQSAIMKNETSLERCSAVAVAGKIRDRRPRFEGARLPAASSPGFKDLRHGWEAVPLQSSNARESSAICMLATAKESGSPVGLTDPHTFSQSTGGWRQPSRSPRELR